ncbi:hypothetical protein WDW86_15075 [Bdellovibrionota bacterium FG-2]
MSSKHGILSPIVLIGCVCALFVAFCLIIIHLTPPHMDEYLHYQPLACTLFPNAIYHQFREACGYYDLAIFGHFLPIRSYGYTGSATALFYLPIFKAFPHYLSARYMGLGSLILFLIGVRLLTRLEWLLILATLGLNFPLAYQMINDTGPVGYSIVLMAWVPLMFGWIIKKNSLDLSIVGGAFIGLTIFLGVEQKPFFLLLSPSIMGLSIWLHHRQGVNRSVRACLFSCGGVLLSLCLILFTARTRTGEIYFVKLISMAANYELFDWQGQWKHLNSFLQTYFFNFAGFAHRVFGDFDSKGILPSLFFWIMLTLTAGRSFLSKQNAQKQGTPQTLAFLLVLSGMSLFLINRNLKSDAGHHIIFVMPYILIALALGLQAWIAKARRVWIIPALLVVSNFYILSLVIRNPPETHSSWDRIGLFEYVKTNLAKRYIISYLDWGTYYIGALYGPQEQIVTYIQPLNEVDALNLKALSEKLQRPLAFVRRKEGTSANWGALERTVGPLTRIFPKIQEGITGEKSAWELWTQQVGTP